MVKKAKTTYVCNECGEDFPQWFGKCPHCGAFNSFKEFREAKVGTGSSAKSGLDLTTVTENQSSTRTLERLSSGQSEVDLVLGGGFFLGSMLLFGGHPGIGKSTLSLQIFLQQTNAMYFTGEESVEQVKDRANRLSVPPLRVRGGEGVLELETEPGERARVRGNEEQKIFATNSLEDIITTITKHRPDLAIIDSIQMIGSESSNFGTTSQIRENAEVLLKTAKSTGTTLLVIGHVTKSDEIAGPKVLEHLVDVVLYLEGDRNSDLRLLRSPKNRYGSTLEVGVFTMEGKGLKSLQNPREYFQSERVENQHGTVLCMITEGNRNFVLEVQSLLVKTNFGQARRTSRGVDLSKIHLLLAVVSKFTPYNCFEYDAYINVVGGLKALDPASDLAVIAAIISSRTETPIASDTLIMGEVGLSGEVRKISRLENRIQEAEKLGFKKVVVPYDKNVNQEDFSIEIKPVKTVGQMLGEMFKR